MSAVAQLEPPAAPSPEARSSPTRALLLALAVAVLWGVPFPVSRIAVRELGPLALAALRFTLATLVLWPAARRRGLQIDRADRPAILGLGLLGVTLYFALENYGLVFTTASHASLIVATIPLVSAAVEAIRRRRWPRPLPITGMAMAAVGVAVIARPDGTGSRALLGDLLVFGAMPAGSWPAARRCSSRLAPWRSGPPPSCPSRRWRRFSSRSGLRPPRPGSRWPTWACSAPPRRT